MYLNLQQTPLHLRILSCMQTRKHSATPATLHALDNGPDDSFSTKVKEEKAMLSRDVYVYVFFSVSAGYTGLLPSLSHFMLIPIDSEPPLHAYIYRGGEKAKQLFAQPKGGGEI